MADRPSPSDDPATWQQNRPEGLAAGEVIWSLFQGNIAGGGGQRQRWTPGWLPWIPSPRMPFRDDGMTGTACVHMSLTKMFSHMEGDNDLETIFQRVDNRLEDIRKRKTRRKSDTPRQPLRNKGTPNRFVYTLLRDAGFRHHRSHTFPDMQDPIRRNLTCLLVISYIPCKYPIRKLKRDSENGRLWGLRSQWGCGCRQKEKCRRHGHMSVMLDGVVVEQAWRWIANPTTYIHSWWTPPSQTQFTLPGLASAGGCRYTASRPR